MPGLRRQGFFNIEATVDAENAWVKHVNEVSGQTLFPLANSWYVGANVPGKPREFMPYIGGVGAYRQKCEAVAANGYEGFAFEPALPGCFLLPELQDIEPATSAASR